MKIHRTVILPVVLYGCVTWSHVKGRTRADDDVRLSEEEDTSSSE